MPVATRLRGIKRGVVAAFDPTSIAGLVAWYDASDASSMFTDDGVTNVSSDAQTIYRINDKSGQGNHLRQATGGLRPVYKTAIQNGKSVARFDGSRYMQTAADPTWPNQSGGTTAFTAIVVVIPTSGCIASSGGSGGTGWGARKGGTSSILTMYGAVDAIVASGYPDDTACVSSYGYTAATFSFYRNGSLVNTAASDAVNSSAGQKGTLGERGTGGGDPYTGDTCDILFYTGLSGADRAVVEAGMKVKWGTP